MEFNSEEGGMHGPIALQLLTYNTYQNALLIFCSFHMLAGSKYRLTSPLIWPAALHR